jgi:hypothetical protein
MPKKRQLVLVKEAMIATESGFLNRELAEVE